MKAWSIAALGLFGLSAATAVSCADLRDSDPCYRVAHQICEKGCAPDQSACIKAISGRCNHPQYQEIDSAASASGAGHCADALESKSSCLSPAAIVEACGDAINELGGLKELSPPIEGPAPLGGACATSGDCEYGIQCSADSGGTCRQSCASTSTCSAGFSCKSVLVLPSGYTDYLCIADTLPGENPDGGALPSKPAKTGKAAGEPCSSTSECDPATSTICQGVCTKQCTTNSSCSYAFSNGPATCAKPAGLTDGYCVARCSSATDCPATGMVCGSVTTVDGTTAQVCGKTTTSTKPGCTDTCKFANDGTCDDPSSSNWETSACATGTDCTDCKSPSPPTKTGGKLGAACSSSGGCAAGLTCNMGWCAAQCDTAIDCSVTSNGNAAVCVGNQCLPTCVTASECVSGTCATIPFGQTGHVCTPPSLTGL
jgi:hypothetical protein